MLTPLEQLMYDVLKDIKNAYNEALNASIIDMELAALEKIGIIVTITLDSVDQKLNKVAKEMEKFYGESKS